MGYRELMEGHHSALVTFTVGMVGIDPHEVRRRPLFAAGCRLLLARYRCRIDRVASAPWARHETASADERVAAVRSIALP